MIKDTEIKTLDISITDIKEWLFDGDDYLQIED